MHNLSYLSGAAFHKGNHVKIAGMATQEKERTLEEILIKDGFEEIQMYDSISLLDAIKSSVEQTISISEVKREEIDAVIFSSESFTELTNHPNINFRPYLAREDVRNTLANELGLKNAITYGSWLSSCGNFTRSLNLANSFIKSETHQNILIIEADKVPKKQSRFMKSGVSIFSDIAASIILGKSGIIEVSGHYASPPMTSNKSAKLTSITEKFTFLNNSFRSLVAQANAIQKSPSSKLTCILCDGVRSEFIWLLTNGQPDIQKLITRNTYKQYGHAFSADGIIALSDPNSLPRNKPFGLLNIGPESLGLVSLRFS